FRSAPCGLRVRGLALPCEPARSRYFGSASSDRSIFLTRCSLCELLHTSRESETLLCAGWRHIALSMIVSFYGRCAEWAASPVRRHGSGSGCKGASKIERFRIGGGECPVRTMASSFAQRCFN